MSTSALGPLLGLLALTAGCATQPPGETVTGQPFLHRIELVDRQDGKLHVYLEGDGTPWLPNGRIARDPGPRQPVTDTLAALDGASTLRLGRPCYEGLANRDPACHPLFWTQMRYSPQVVDSLVAALEGILAKLPGGERRLSLIGHSGGGVLAMLMAERLHARRPGIVTLGTPADIDAWARWHDYSPLTGSSNARDVLPALADLPQAHHAGALDGEVPPALAPPGAIVHPGFDHHCCWKTLWPAAVETF